MGIIVIAGSRSINDGWQDHKFNVLVAQHNGNLLDAVVRRSGYHTHPVNLHIYKGPHTKIHRGTPWGNPFTHLDSPTMATFKVKTRAESIERYKDWFIDQPHLHTRLDELRGMALGCFCKPADCHGDFLADLAGRITGVVSGTAHGADRLGEQWAETNHVPVTRVAAEWDLYGKAAGMRRNRKMAELPEVEGGIVLIDAAGSRGSANMIEELARVGKPCYVQKVRVENHLGYAVD